MARITLDEAKARIAELEKENAALKEELEYYKNRKMSGRRKHNDKWQASYQDFLVQYEKGLSMIEIAKECGFSRRTAYRFKDYYDSVNNK